LSVPEDVDPKSAGYLGSLLIGFLSFYSTFESDRMAIDLKDGGKFYNKKDCPIPLETKKGKLTIVDPDVPGKHTCFNDSFFAYTLY
jgi:DNA polymerase sigma